jgi:hypothetical protein
MSSVITTVLYRHYQITIEETISNRFQYRIDNPNTNKSIVHKSISNYTSALDAENAAKASVDTFPSNSCRSLITAVTGSDSVSDEIIDSLMAGLFVVELAIHEHPLDRGINEEYEYE